MAEVREHYRPLGEDYDPGVYRVVGASKAVTLLRVTDADDRRVHSGELIQVAPETLDAEFEPADDPDAKFSPVREVRNLLSGMYWSVRRFF